MTVSLSSKHSFPAAVVARAVSFPAGHYVEVDDLAHSINGLGRKIVQSHVVEAGGRFISLGYLNVDETGYCPIQTDLNPVGLGAYDTIIRDQAKLFSALHDVFGGTADSYTHLEMVWALRKAAEHGTASLNDVELRSIAAWAQQMAKRSTWVHLNVLEAIEDAPVIWTSKGL